MKLGELHTGVFFTLKSLVDAEKKAAAAEDSEPNEINEVYVKCFDGIVQLKPFLRRVILPDEIEVVAGDEIGDWVPSFHPEDFP